MLTTEPQKESSTRRAPNECCKVISVDALVPVFCVGWKSVALGGWVTIDELCERAADEPLRPVFMRRAIFELRVLHGALGAQVSCTARRRRRQ